MSGPFALGTWRDGLAYAGKNASNISIAKTYKLGVSTGRCLCLLIVAMYMYIHIYNVYEDDEDVPHLGYTIYTIYEPLLALNRCHIDTITYRYCIDTASIINDRSAIIDPRWSIIEHRWSITTHRWSIISDDRWSIINHRWLIIDHICVPWGVPWDPWVGPTVPGPMGPGPHGPQQLLPKSFPRYLWISLDIHSYPWQSMDIHVYPWMISRRHCDLWRVCWLVGAWARSDVAFRPTWWRTELVSKFAMVLCYNPCSVGQYLHYWILSLDDIYGWYQWIIPADNIHRNSPWIVSMDIVHGCYPCISMDKIHG